MEGRSTTESVAKTNTQCRARGIPRIPASLPPLAMTIKPEKTQQRTTNTGRLPSTNCDRTRVPKAVGTRPVCTSKYPGRQDQGNPHKTPQGWRKLIPELHKLRSTGLWTSLVHSCTQGGLCGDSRSGITAKLPTGPPSALCPLGVGTNLAILNCMRCNLRIFLIWISLMTEDIEHFFRCF